MYPRFDGPLFYYHSYLPLAIISWICMLIALAGFVFFLVTAWRFMRAHEELSGTLREIAGSLKQSGNETR